MPELLLHSVIIVCSCSSPSQATVVSLIGLVQLTQDLDKPFLVPLTFTARLHRTEATNDNQTAVA